MGIDKSNVNEFRNWIEIGISKGWVSDVFCNIHDGGPMTEEELQAWEDGQDPCSTHIRVWDDV
jgi:hypothetical protein